MLTYRQLAGGSKRRWRSNHQAADDKSKTQTRRRGSDWQQDSCPGPSAGAKWVFAAAGHERLSPDEGGGDDGRLVGVGLSKALEKWFGRMVRGTRREADGGLVNKGGVKAGRAVRSARWWRLNQYTPRAASLSVPDGSVQGGLAGPTRGSVSGLRHSLSGEN